MGYRVREDCSIQSTVFGQLEERSFKAGSVEPKSEVEEALLDLLIASGHAEIVADAPVTDGGKK
jgi:hypothetical protein